jgi:hypothetical protein
MANMNFPKTSRPAPEAYPASGDWNFFWEQKGRSVKLTTHLHLAPKLRMSGAERLLPLYALMTRAGTTVPLANL